MGAMVHGPAVGGEKPTLPAEEKKLCLRFLAYLRSEFQLGDDWPAATTGPGSWPRGEVTPMSREQNPELYAATALMHEALADRGELLPYEEARELVAAGYVAAADQPYPELYEKPPGHDAAVELMMSSQGKLGYDEALRKVTGRD